MESQVAEVRKGSDGRWYKPCPKCGEEQSYLRKNYALHSLRLGKLCRKCSNRETVKSHRGWHRGIRISWFNQFKSSAETRGIYWGITVDDVADIMEGQNNKCALTDWNIEFPECGHPNEAPASIDRIDSEVGYTRENSQLLTRQVNMMKQHYSQEDFIEVCKAIASNTKLCHNPKTSTATHYAS